MFFLSDNMICRLSNEAMCMKSSYDHFKCRSLKNNENKTKLDNWGHVSGVKDQINYWEGRKKVFQKVDSEEVHNHYCASNLSPACVVIEFVSDDNIGYNHTSAVNIMTYNPEADIFPIDTLLLTSEISTPECNKINYK